MSKVSQAILRLLPPLLVLFIAIEIGDAITTWINVAYGFGEESTQGLAWAIQHFGLTGTLIGKVGGAALVAGILYKSLIGRSVRGDTSLQLYTYFAVVLVGNFYLAYAIAINLEVMAVGLGLIDHQIF